MHDSFFDKVVVPVANRDDAAATTSAVAHYVDDRDATVIAIHVIEKARGTLDKASVEHRELAAEDIFDVVVDGLSDLDVSVETEIRYSADVADAIIEAAHEREASAIVFTPRGGSRWRKLLTGDVSHKLVENSDVPILSLPDEPQRET